MTVTNNNKNYKLWNMLDSKGSSLTELAALLDISYTTMHNKLNNKTEFTASEIKKIKEHYSLTFEEVGDIFL